MVAVILSPAPRARRALRGVAAVELALTLVPLLILAFGVAEFGRAMFTYNALDKAARDAARYLTAPPPTAINPDQDAANLVVYGNVGGTGTRLAPNLTTGQVVISRQTNVATGSGVANLVTVSITGYVYNSIVTYVAPATINFNAISVTMRTNL